MLSKVAGSHALGDRLLEVLRSVGLAVKNAVLGIAGLLRDESAPGIVTLVLLFGLLVCIALFLVSVARRRSALSWLRLEFVEVLISAEK